jgi:hypothetical protein
MDRGSLGQRRVISGMNGPAVAGRRYVAGAVSVGCEDLERDLRGLTEDTPDRLRNQAAHSRPKPFLDELRRNADDESPVFDPETAGILQPRIVIRTRNVNLELA